MTDETPLGRAMRHRTELRSRVIAPDPEYPIRALARVQPIAQPEREAEWPAPGDNAPHAYRPLCQCHACKWGDR